MSEIQILIVEDEPMIAEDLADICKELGYEVFETALTAGQAMVKLKTEKPDIVLLDVNLEDDIDGIQIAEYINEHLKCPFIFITSYADDVTIDRAKRTKPMGYIVKPFRKQDLFSAIEIALYNFNRMILPVGLDLATINQQFVAKITQREFDILSEIYKGKSNKQICKTLNISENTTKYHIKNLYSKMDVNSRTELLAKVMH
jgi:DNA-binding NarL/FixJ family response regulator